MNNGDTARTEIRRARSFLEYADDDLATGRWARAVSSSYYAVFHAAKAVLAWTNTKAKTYGGVKRSFSRQAVSKSDFPSEVARTFGRLEQMRLTADYDAVEWETFTQKEARCATNQAGSFVEEADKWLRRRTEE